ncbi:MAG: SRPBCC family protein [Acidimicrobiales bacterium]|jgi:uncharacterized protein YndB with AHSA1/START domain|nr:SRPBCC family protein [Acidimicrobiales bacterium]|tara:strand:+ start:769 stop:1239 length:471 start_codon:yes stop_codon:yes gene_type:complete
MEGHEAETRSVSASVTVSASPAEVFDLLRRPERHGEFDGSGTVKSVVNGPEVLEEGSTFTMSMHMGLPYRIRNRVVEFEADRRIAWRHFGRHRWRYELEEVEAGCRVTETFDYSAGPLWFYRRANIPARNLASIEATLQRLAAIFTTANDGDNSRE